MSIRLAEVSTQSAEGELVTGFLIAECGSDGRGQCQMKFSISRANDPR